MAKDAQLLTTSEFAKKAGIPVSKVTKLIRDGKIQAEKKSGKWMIAPGQLKAAEEASKTPTKQTAKKKAAPKAPAEAPIAPTTKKKNTVSAGKSYSIVQFAEMTYLTEKGVMEGLKQGRLTGGQDSKGEWQVDAANLENPNMKHLVR